MGAYWPPLPYTALRCANPLAPKSERTSMIAIANHPDVGARRIRSLNVVDGLVSVTQQAWEAAPLHAKTSGKQSQYAPAKTRDQFLAALETDDRERLIELAIGLTQCGNPLPGMTCGELDVPLGSTYGDAARRIMQRRGDGRTEASDPQ
jgi:hypothetical protein